MKSTWWRTGLLVGALMLLVGCKKASLLEGLDERQANEVVAVMLYNNIDAKKLSAGKGTFAVEVSGADLAQAIDLVHQHDLPSPAITQISEVFPADAMVSTPLSERARLYSAIEQRLEESLKALSGVRRARVDVSYDLRTSSGLGQGQIPDGMRLAAVIVHEPGVDDQVLLQSVKRFLRNTFVNLEYDNISVVMSVAQPTRALGTTPVRTSATSDWRLLAGLVLFLAVAGVALAAFTRRGRRNLEWVSGLARRLELDGPASRNADR